MYVIGCLRADYYNRWLDDQQLVQLSNGNDNQYALPSIHGYQFKAIIESPAQAAGLTFETHDEGEYLAEVLLTDAEGESNSLPLLQFTLEKLYLAKQDNTLTFVAYQQLGGITKAISKTAEQLLATLPYGDSLFKAVISTLVAIDEEGNKSRQSALLASFDIEQRKLVDALINARLLVAEQDKIRLTHDKLLEHWQSLNDWYHEDLDFRRWLARINKEAILWQQHKRAKDYLLSAGKKLLEAKRFIASHRQSIVAVELSHQAIIKFVQASSRSQRNKARFRAGIIGAVMVVLSGLLGYSFQQQRLAVAQQQIAEQQKGQAQVQQQKAEALLSQTRNTLNFMNFELGDALKQYAPVRVRVKINEQIDTLLTALQKHAPKDDSSRYNQAVAIEQEADVLLQDSNADPAGALALYQQAYQIKQDLVAQNPDVSFYKQSLSASHDTLGDSYLRLGDTDKAKAAYQAALAIRKKLILQDDSNTDFKRGLAMYLSNMGNIYLRQGDTDKAFEAYQAVLVIVKKLSLQDDSNTQFKRDLSVTLSKMGDIYLLLGGDG